MRLSCQKAFLVLLVSTIGCHDTTAPERISTGFVLQSVSGQPLPAVLFSDATSSRTVISSTLILTMDGHAFMGESYRDDSQGIVTQPTFVATLDYRLHGEQIEIGTFTPCPMGSFCLENATGTLSNGTLTLNHPWSALLKVYFYTTGPFL
jgi:hypothetical protein